MTLRRDTSASSAARFLALRSRRPRPRVTQESIDAVHPIRWMHAVDDLARRAPRDRVLVDLGRGTAESVYHVLCDALASNELRGRTLDLTVIAVEMLGSALGLPPTDDPPLTDRDRRGR